MGGYNKLDFQYEKKMLTGNKLDEKREREFVT